MSGIYIPWMSMPKTCDDCQVSADCPNDEHIDGYNMQNRPRFCQLVSVPEHGRLIDADALLKHKGNCYDADGHLLYAVGTGNILCAPTIIPADKEGEG